MDIFKGSINLFTLRGLENYYKYLNNIVTDADEIEIEFDYPIKKPISMKYTIKDKGFWSNRDDFTLMSLILFIRDGYMKIYENEQKYGVWGHNIGSLFIEGIYKDDDTFTLSIGS